MPLIGRLRTRITLQSSTPSQDAHGQPIDAWANLATNPTVWANIRTRGGGEQFIAGAEQVQAEIKHTITIRYRSDVTPKMRALEGSRVLLIENVFDQSDRGRWLTLECREVQP